MRVPERVASQVSWYVSTAHASSAQQEISRFTSCVLQSGVELPYRAIKNNIGDSLNVVIQPERRPGKHFVSEALEIHGYDSDRNEYNHRKIFNRDKEAL
jgi:pilus assembly protein CpaF